MKKSERLKIVRILSGFTQVELAAKLDIPQGSLAVMERGKYGVAGETGIAIADVLGVPFEYLYSGNFPVDSESGNVWIPLPPARSQHLQSMFNDIKLLFPQFLAENTFNLVYSFSLMDGGRAFFIGRRTEAKRSKNEYSCLLLADKPLVDCFKMVFREINKEIDYETLLHCTTETFSADELNFAVRQLEAKCNVESLSVKLAEARSNKIKNIFISNSMSNFESLKVIFRSMVSEISRYCLPHKDEVLQKMEDLFVHLCKTIGCKPVENVDSAVVIADIEKVLLSAGCELNIENRQVVNILHESKELQYLYFKYWLQETWLEATPEQKDALTEVIRKNTDYDLWLEKVRLDKKPRPILFDI